MQAEQKTPNLKWGVRYFLEVTGLSGANIANEVTSRPYNNATAISGHQFHTRNAAMAPSKTKRYEASPIKPRREYLKDDH